MRASALVSVAASLPLAVKVPKPAIVIDAVAPGETETKRQAAEVHVVPAGTLAATPDTTTRPPTSEPGAGVIAMPTLNAVVRVMIRRLSPSSPMRTWAV